MALLEAELGQCAVKTGTTQRLGNPKLVTLSVRPLELIEAELVIGEKEKVVNAGH